MAFSRSRYLFASFSLILFLLFLLISNSATLDFLGRLGTLAMAYKSTHPGRNPPKNYSIILCSYHITHRGSQHRTICYEEDNESVGYRFDGN